MTAKEIRQAFLTFFYAKAHAIVPSAPIVVKDDPTLMFTNAGMNQFKDFFLGNRQAPAKRKRVTDTQKCLRVSGKHNDLEEVGVDTYHHTMFEMLGNWSFGDYFKKEAIAWAWELLTEVYGLDKSRLYATVFGGEISEKLDQDDEAIELWKQHIDADRILSCSKDDNFWEMGDTGPCGPCSEIHVDLRSDAERAKVDGKTLVNQDHPLVVEIWNLVFVQYNRKSDGQLENLPDKHIDTGMGFERLTMALQGKTSNYDTDIFMPLIQQWETISGFKYGKDEKIDIAFRVIVDHIRAISFTIADGQLPSNTGAGYVIRRILRRAVRYAYNFFNRKEASIYQLVTILADQFEHVFPELKEQQSFVEKVIKEEESNFLNTLESGLKKFEALSKNLKEGDILDGENVFELYDTYGFPLDLTALLAREQGLKIDQHGFEASMKRQKDRSRKDAQTEHGDWHVIESGADSEFVGYDELSAEVKVLKYRTLVKKKKKHFQVILNKTPFYPEGGGQKGDQGFLKNAKERIRVLDTVKENQLILHEVEQLPEHPETVYEAQVDKERRFASQKNHSATHLMHAALKEVLGDHVQQKGSMLNDQYLRFDFSHYTKLTKEEIKQVEQIVNDRILAGIPLTEYRSIPKEEALAKGATALFGEKYGDQVRMIVFDPSFSLELCGGTHVQNTAEIGVFKISAESAVAAGVRRIEAVTGKGALKLIDDKLEQLAVVQELFKNPKSLEKAVQSHLSDYDALAKQVEGFKYAHVQQLKQSLMNDVIELNGINVIAKVLDNLDGDSIKQLSYELKNSLENAALVFGVNAGSKALLSIMFDENIVQKHSLDAGALIKELSKEIQGGGGGQKFYATAGGSKKEGLPVVIETVLQRLKNLK